MSPEREAAVQSLRGRIVPSVLGGGAVVLVAIIVTWSGGITGFMHGVAEELDAIAILILVSLIGTVFVLLYSLGLSIGYAEEIEPLKT